MTDWTQRIDEALLYVADPRKAVKALMNEYAIERLEELKGQYVEDEVGAHVVYVHEISVMQERLAKGQDK